MLKFALNALITIGFILLFGVYFLGRYSDAYPTCWLYKIDGLLQSLISATFFLGIVFFLMKPSIKIASVIAELPSRDGKPPHMRIKIVNTSLFRAYDLEVNIYEKASISISGNDITTSLLGHYEGARQGTGYMQSGFKALFQKEKTNAVQLTLSKIMGRSDADDTIKRILKSDSFLEIHVSVRHGFSSLLGNYTKTYHNTSHYKLGLYKHGFDTSIVLAD